MKGSYQVAVASFLLLGCVCSFPSGEKPLQPQGSGTKGVDQQMLDFYRTQSRWTDPGKQQAMFEDIPDDIGSIVESVQGVLIHGGLVWLYKLNPSEAQDNGFKVRRTEDMLQRIKFLDNTPLGDHRPKDKRLVVNCRQFAVLTCSILRHKGIPARARAGYAMYTWGRGKYENHWICEYWNKNEQRWIQVDAQIDSQQKKLMRIDFNTLDIPRGKFVVAGEGWRRYRDGSVPVEYFGLGGKDGWNPIGWGMVMPNVTCDLMALNKMELLPWDVSLDWKKEKAAMSPEDIAMIEKAATLSSQVNSHWPQMP